MSDPHTDWGDLLREALDAATAQAKALRQATPPAPPLPPLWTCHGCGKGIGPLDPHKRRLAHPGGSVVVERYHPSCAPKETP